MEPDLSLTDLIDKITDLLKRNKNFKQVVIKGDKTSIIIEEDKVEEKKPTKQSED